MDLQPSPNLLAQNLTRALPHILVHLDATTLLRMEALNSSWKAYLCPTEPNSIDTMNYIWKTLSFRLVPALGLLQSLEIPTATSIPLELFGEDEKDEENLEPPAKKSKTKKASDEEEEEEDSEEGEDEMAVDSGKNTMAKLAITSSNVVWKNFYLRIYFQK